jgi:hypothetical protein
MALAFASLGCGKNLGKKIEKEGCELHLKKVDEAKGENTLDFLVEQKVCTGPRKTMQLRKKDGQLEWRVVIKKGLHEDEETVKSMKILGGALSAAVFGGEQIDVHLCDDKMKTLKVVPASAPTAAAPSAQADAGEQLVIPNSTVALTRPPGWLKTKKGDWGLLASPDKKALLAFVVYTKPNESTTRLGQVASVLGASNIKWGSPKPNTFGKFQGREAAGTCSFGSKGGVMAYVLLDTGSPKKVLVVYAIEEGATKADHAQAKSVVQSLRPAG